jgi:alginate lyase
VKLIRGGNSREEPEPDNYANAFNDVAAAYQTGLRWKISGDTTYAEKSIQILNAWASTCTTLSGDPNIALAAGIYGYQFAVAGELMRDYKGWKAADFTAYQQWMLKLFYTMNHNFLLNHQNSCPEHYWANWDLCNLASMMAIGILTDKRTIYNEAVNYFQRGVGNGNIRKAINYVWKDQGLAQLQESGRDQGHATLVIALLGTICEIAYHQGDDFYAFNDNMVLKAAEHTAKYNVANLSVPFQSYTYNNCSTTTTLTQISADGRGTVRPMWAIVYNHYVKRKGLTATYTQMGVQTTQPEGGGGDYGPNSGGFDQLGFGTLLYTR